MQDIGRKRHRSQDSVHVDTTSAPRNHQQPSQLCNVQGMDFLAPINALVEQAWQSRCGQEKNTGSTQHQQQPSSTLIPSSAWDQWLWLEDPMEEVHIDLLLNRMQLVGLLIARYNMLFGVLSMRM